MSWQYWCQPDHTAHIELHIKAVGVFADKNKHQCFAVCAALKDYANKNLLDLYKLRFQIVTACMGHSLQEKLL